MPDYVIRIFGHIDENKRPREVSKDFPNGFPRKVREDSYIQAENSQGVFKSINDEITKYLRLTGMWVRRNPDELLDAKKLEIFDRMFVPLHMITHITADFQMLSAEIPMVDQNGTAFLTSGKELVKH
jgi:hypothetical protein